MKNLRLAIVAAFASLSVFTSCVKTDVLPMDDSAYLDLTFMATADSGHTHKGGGKGKITEIAPEALSATIKTYISTKYAGATVKHAGQTESGKFIVHLVLADGTTNKGLVFDAAGVFISEKTKGTGKGKGTAVALSALPKAITDYISANYAGSTTEKAFQGTDGNYGVGVKKADGTKVIVAFDKDGKFVSELAHKDHGKKGGPKRGK